MMPLVINLIIAMGVMGFFYALYCFKNDPSIVDVAFTLSLMSMSVATYGFLSEKTSASHLFLLMTLLWGSRLSILLIARYQNGQKDLRYQELKKSFSSNEKKKFFLFFAAQAAAAYVLSLNFVVAYHTQSAVHQLQLIAFLLFILFLSLEILADYQMFQHRQKGATHRGVFRQGLWKYSRHPNYFFEVLVWCTFALFASTTGFALISWAAVAVLLISILKITGIPALEELMCKNYGDEYRNYQKTTSAFIPWFVKK